MKTFSITMSDGSQGRCLGIFSDGFAAITTVMDSFPDAQRISARRLP